MGYLTRYTINPQNTLIEQSDDISNDYWYILCIQTCYNNLQNLNPYNDRISLE